MTFKDGWVENPKTGKRENVVVSGSPVNVKDICVGTILIVSGVVYMVRKAFRRGAEAYHLGETKALIKIGCL